MGSLTVEKEDGVAVLVLDQRGESVNKLSRAVKDEVMGAVRELAGDQSVRAMVLISGKPDVFIAGADIAEFVAAKTEADFHALSREGHRDLDELAASPKPVVVAINGACLGGGLEVSLACHYRVASSNPKTVLALPEVQLGIIPGAGGCNRLPRLVGLSAALDMILTGRNVRADKALRMGLVDEVVHPAILRRVATDAARRLAKDGLPVREPRGSRLLDRTAPGRFLVLLMARRTALRKSGGNYPAIPAALDTIAFSLKHGMTRGLEKESELFAKMAMTDVSRRLVEIFFATTALKKDPGVAPPAPEPRAVNRIGVLGAGFMGAGIAVTAADVAGLPVRMKDADLPRVGKGLKSAADIIGESVKRRRYHRREGARKLALITGTTDYSGFANADLVIEAVFEDLELKQTVLREVESVMRPDAIFASNTSTIPIGRIAQASCHPETVVGMHFFSPVHRMPLLEVIAADRTAGATVVTAVALGRRMGKTAIVVKDRPGFYINRILAPYMSEAGHLLADGAAIEDLDRAMVRWGFPVGPVTLFDEVGLDVAVKVGEVMHEALGDRLKPAVDLTRLVSAGRLGRKNGRGFFAYEKGRKRGVDGDVYETLGVARGPAGVPGHAAIAERLSLLMLNEAARALEEEIIRSPRDGDIGAIFGIGFPPFRGGPFRELDAMGARAAVDALERLTARHGPRFAPSTVLVDLARSGGRFHPES